MTEPVSATISLGYLPKSYNSFQHAHWRYVHRHKQLLQRDLEIVLMACKDLPRPVPGGKLSVRFTLIVPDRRRRDVLNFAAPLDKALGDALQAVNAIPDDTPDHYSFDGASFEYVKGVRALRVHLEW